MSRTDGERELRDGLIPAALCPLADGGQTRLEDHARDHPNDMNMYIMELENGLYLDARYQHAYLHLYTDKAWLLLNR